ncbi:hypothetical protein [Mycobacterium lepromatosis]|uniref:hypothetical protein n=1 Tax=Mycobacterium lepromatosis TaxID=480418 RepID=UPI000A891074|nr:hypothetical protein [Mycobacterium lepromatosis]
MFGAGYHLRAARIMLILGLLPATLPACDFSESHHKPTIGVSYSTASNPLWNAYTRFIDEGSRQLGVDINAVSAEEDKHRATGRR